MPTFLDTFFIILFIVVVSVIIGLNIVHVVDKKISDVSINVPETKVYVNICEDSKGKIKVDFKDGINKKNVENFIVSDAQDFHNYKDHRKKTEKEINIFNHEKIDIPLDKDKVDYDKDKDDRDFYTGIQYDFRPRKAKKDNDERKKKAYVSDVDFGWEVPRQVVSCANSSISQQFKTGKKSLMPFQIDCRRPNKLTAENYYKTHYKAQIIPIEDHLVRGHNYLNYTNWVEPTKIDYRILSQSTKGLPNRESAKHIPVGWNYGFHNTPAMTMP